MKKRRNFISEANRQEVIAKTSKSEKVKSIPGWYNQLIALSYNQRRELVEKILYNVSTHGSLKDEPTAEGKEMVKWLKQSCDLIGFTPCVTYLKASGDREEMDVTYIHPWGYLTLVYKHKKFPFLITVNSGMRKDKMILASIPANKGVFDGLSVVGIVG